MAVNKIFEKYSGVNISILPTPLHRLENISKLFNANVYCKRDDMTGFAFGGNKTRKLEFLIADAKKKKANVLIGIGGVQSNFCRIASAAGSAYGLDVHLVLGGSKKPMKVTGNLLLDKLFGAKTHFVESENWADWEEYANDLCKNLTKKGKRVYWMPIGGSSVIGVLGYIKAFNEIMLDCKRMNLKFDYILHSTSSGGTQSGLVVGAKLNNWEGKIIGIGVSANESLMKKDVVRLSCETGKLFKVDINEDDVIVDDNYIGKKYGTVTKAGIEAMDLFAKREGILLDYVYSAKAASGLLDYLRKEYFKKDENILFIHTG